jgi:hypothetical protein
MSTCRTNRWDSCTTWLPYPLPGNIIQHSHWEDWIPLPTKLKSINSELYSNTNSGGGGGMLNLHWRIGVGQEVNSQWTNAGKTTKLRVGVRRQAKLPEEPLAPSRDQERHKVWEQGWGNRPTSQSGAGVGLQDWSHGTEVSIQNRIASPWGVRTWTNRVAAEGQCSCSLVKTTAMTTLHELVELPHLTIATNAVNRRNKILLRTQSPAETISELPLVCQHQDWMLKE